MREIKREGEIDITDRDCYYIQVKLKCGAIAD